ncbi:response regulator transcription factor [Peptoniphilus mikwangii]|uniref:response regulator transcription factor n=1 Tax=Peptoniphilus mikwangii TaxID=1354300 RepID=UPI0003F67035|nr:LuxR C-terminal-related transcriptional regulator [Peptoniphilus mikwangii]
MITIYLSIKEEIFRIGIERALEEKYNIKYYSSKENTDKSSVIISDEEIKREKTITIFENKNIAAYSKSENKLLKNVSVKELQKSVEEILKGNTYVQYEIEELSEQLKNFEKQYADLTIKDREIIREILSGHTNKQIAKGMYLSEKTIKNNITELYKKLEINNRTELIKKCKICIDIEK